MKRLGYDRLKKVWEKSSPKDLKKKILSPWASYSRFWSKIFLVSCVIGVSIDPLFLYIPVINEDEKCLAMDQKMKIVAVVLRTLTDFTYLLHLIFRLKDALSMAKLLGSSIYNEFPRFYLFIDVLAILPHPQVRPCMQLANFKYLCFKIFSILNSDQGPLVLFIYFLIPTIHYFT